MYYNKEQLVVSGQILAFIPKLRRTVKTTKYQHLAVSNCGYIRHLSFLKGLCVLVAAVRTSFVLRRV